MAGGYTTNGYSNGFSATRLPQTLTALNRWSVAGKQLPAVEKIKAIHVYDFDNTLFNSPLPNPKLWNGPSIGFLQTQDTFTNGGWWHDARILAATGDGVEKEEPRGWEGWWNEKIVELVELSMRQKDALSVLLTGRSEESFSELVKKMAAAKGLDFDMVSLKPVAGPNNQRFANTMNFKQVFLRDLVETYKDAEEIRVYEDRVKHVKGFRDFFTDYNKQQNSIGGNHSRGSIVAEVIHVADGATQLDPVVETSEVQRLINDHNLAVARAQRGRRFAIKKTIFYTGYLISNSDTQKLLTLAQLPPNMPDTEMKYLANNILITPRPCPNSILDKVGGMGNKLLWEVTGTAVFENKIWAASVRPVPQSAKYYTENPVPIVVLALRKGARPIDAGKIQNWQPVPPEKAHIFETTVGEKVLLRVEEEDPRENQYESLFPNKTFKRKHVQDDKESQSRQQGGFGGQGGRGGHQGNQRGHGNRGGFRGNNASRGRGSGGNGRGGHNGGTGGGGGGGGNGGGRNRGKGGGYNYRSLDDIGGGDGGNTGVQQGTLSVPYDDFPPLHKSYGQPQNNHHPQPQQRYQQYQQHPQFNPNNGTSGGGYGQDVGGLPYY